MTFHDIVDHYAADIYRFCRSLTLTKDDAEDLVQQVFLRACIHMNKLTNHPHPKAFLFKMAVYEYKDSQRKYARRQRIAPISELTDNLASDMSLEQATLQKEKHAMLHQVIDRLPAKFKLPIVMHYTNDMSLADIAKALGIPQGTVKSRLHKARQLIKKGLINHGYE